MERGSISELSEMLQQENSEDNLFAFVFID